MAKASDTSNKIVVPVEERPRCQHKGCTTHAQHMGTYNKNGYPFFRKLCTKHHSAKTASKHGLKSIIEVIAKKAGVSVTEYTNSMHPYRKHRKEYCENRDGRLKFKCRYKIRHSGQLQVDHINGNPEDNRPKNLQTLCANCHIYKTHLKGDYKTPGRKALKEAKKQGFLSKLLDNK
jgi:5-methylcytosine-specific restriction endonuclease McrA